MTKSGLTFDQLLERQYWPLEPVLEEIFPLNTNPLVAASQVLSLVAYPRESEGNSGGPGHKFAGALVADLLRLAKKNKRLAVLPQWVLHLKPETMRNRIRQGQGRLFHRLAAIQTIFEAGERVDELRSAKSGETRTFITRFSANFSRLSVTIPYREEQTEHGIGHRLIGQIPDPRQASLKAAIIFHREAFGMGRGDEGEEYRNIHSRYVKPIFSVFNLALVVWDAWMEKAAEATKRRLHLTDILMLQPEWAEHAARKARERDAMAILLLREAGVVSCSCRMLKLG